MNPILLNLISIVVFLLMMSLLVAAHELGHYLAARKVGMGVYEFAIGMGRPKLCKWLERKQVFSDGTENTTEFTIRALPLGGFVRIFGQDPTIPLEPSQESKGFHAKSPMQRIFVLIAGPIFSILAGVFLLAVVFTTAGEYKQTTKISRVVVGSAADEAGIAPGDRIVSMNGRVYSDAGVLRHVINSNQNQPLQVVVERAGKTIELPPLTPKLSNFETMVFDKDGRPTLKMAKQPLMGVLFEPERRRIPFSQALAAACIAPIDAATNLIQKLRTPAQMVQETKSPVGMYTFARNAVTDGLATVLELAGMLSISLGFFNLFPIGMLDGGQILISFIEWIRRGKKLSTPAQNAIMGSGTIALLCLVVLMTLRDTRDLITGEDSTAPKTPNIKLK